MILKNRSESHELLAFRYLNNRMKLSDTDRQHYLNLEKGYEGELKFDRMAEGLEGERYIINDLLLEVNKSFFQIDTLIISQAVIHLLDIKNFEGDYYLESDKLYFKPNGREYKNPVDQLKRSTILFRQLLQKLKQNYVIDASVIYINPEFSLYQAPLDQPIIFPTQVNRFLKNLSKAPSKLNDGHIKLAQALISLHHTENPFAILPEYNYQDLPKGLTCFICNSFSTSIVGKKCVCKDCGHEEMVADTVIRCVNEILVLFPTQRITTNVVHEWCNGAITKRRIREALAKKYNKVGLRQWSFYQ